MWVVMVMELELELGCFRHFLHYLVLFPLK
jgi:hypothetical protein